MNEQTFPQWADHESLIDQQRAIRSLLYRGFEMTFMQRVTKKIKGTMKYDRIDVIDIQTGIPWLVFYFEGKEIARKRFEYALGSPIAAISITDLKGSLTWRVL